jgi:hypothetical protein
VELYDSHANISEQKFWKEHDAYFPLNTLICIAAGIIQLSITFLFIMSTNTDFIWMKVLAHSLRISFHCHVCNFQHAKYVYIFIIYFCTKFHIPRCQVTLVISIRQKAKCEFCMVTVLCHILQKMTDTSAHFIRFFTSKKVHDTQKI